MIKEYWNLTGREPFLSTTWELDFSQAYSFPRMLMKHKNFHFTQIPGRNNDVIFLKSSKTMFLDNFWPFLPYEDSFQKNFAVTQNYIWAPNIMLNFKKKKKKSQSQENFWTGGRAGRRRKRHTLFYRTLPAEARGSKTSLQQVTHGNTPNLVLKRILGYVRKIPENIPILRLK